MFCLLLDDTKSKVAGGAAYPALLQPMIVIINLLMVNHKPNPLKPKPKFKFAGLVPQPTYFFARPQKSKQKMALKFTPAAGRVLPTMSLIPSYIALAARRPLGLQVGSITLSRYRGYGTVCLFIFSVVHYFLDVVCVALATIG